MGGKKQTIGYHYLMTLVFGLCRNAINEVREIAVGDKTAWAGHMCTDDSGVINAPNLFGGKDKEGGIQGGFYLYMGKPDQVLRGATTINTATGQGIGKNFAGVVAAALSGPVYVAKMRNLRQILPGQTSQLRGVTTFQFNGLISSMNPYPKEWSFRLRRSTAGWVNDAPWYFQKATIWMGDGKIAAMNGAHIIYQLLTDPDWGAGEEPEEISNPSFLAVANTLCTEGLGLCFKWERKDDVDKFIGTVLDHIGGALFTDRETGLYTLKLIRGDYVAADLPLFTRDTGLIEIVEDDSEALADAVNEVIATGKNPLDRGNDIQVRAQNIAAIQANGARVTASVDYPGAPTNDLLMRLAQRDLKTAALGLKRYKVKLDRRAWRMYPSMPFRVSDPKKNLSNIVLRAGEISDTTDMTDGYILVSAVEDVFSMPLTTFAAPVDSEWQGPSLIALPPLEQRLVEASYRDAYLQLGPANVDSLANTDSLIGQLAAAANVSNREYELWGRLPPADYEFRAEGFYSDFGLLATPLDPYEDTLLLSGLTAGFIPQDQVGKALLIGDEIVGVVSYDSVDDSFTISRGTVDTLPQYHALGAHAWTIDDDLQGDPTLYQLGQTINTKVLSKTSSDILPIEDAIENSITVVARQARPYPPGNFQVGGVPIFSPVLGVHPEPEFTWSHRDRTLQDDFLIAHEDGDIGPETGTTYTFRIYDFLTDTLLSTHAGITTSPWTYDATMQTADGNPNRVRVEAESVRDGMASYQEYNFSVTLTGGYGYGYGLNYGGS